MGHFRPPVCQEFWNLTEARLLVKACDDGTLAGARDRAMILLGLLHGLRRSEIVGLTRSRVAIESPSNGSHMAGLLVLESTKTSDFDRMPLDPRTAAAIRKYLAALPRLPGLRERIFWRLNRVGRIPPIPRALHPDAVRRIVARRCLLAGINVVSPHALRHTCATLALEAGTRIERVQAHLRHKDPNTTIRYYRKFQTLRNDTTAKIRV